MAILSLNPIIKRRVLLSVVLSACSVLLVQGAWSQNYSSLLVKGLLQLEYPLSRDDVVALDTISMRFDAKNRIDVLTRILRDRQGIHTKKKGSSFEKTEVICHALHLLDEMNLPITKEIIRGLVKEESWQEKERRLLCYMAAKRSIDYTANIRCLVESLPGQKTNLETEWNGEISHSITDICDTLSALTELFVYRGDKELLDGLLRYAGRAYGYPKEYLSHMFVEILLQRPRLFIDILTEKDTQTANLVINSLLFAVWRNDAKDKVDILLKEELGGEEYSHNLVVVRFREKLETMARFNEEKQERQQSNH
jgi:hypothetical protein